MLRSPEGEDKWLLTEISSFDVPVKRKSFPKEAATVLRDTLDSVLPHAFSLYKNYPMAFSAYDLFVLFRLLCLRPLPNG